MAVDRDACVYDRFSNLETLKKTIGFSTTNHDHDHTTGMIAGDNWPFPLAWPSWKRCSVFAQIRLIFEI